MANMGTYNSEFNKIELAMHNNYRAMHGAPPLKLDEEVAKSA